MASKYTIEEGKLTVHGVLEGGEDTEFDKWLRKLLESPGRELIVDLDDVSYVSSTYIGLIGAVGIEARARGKELCVIAQGKVLETFREAGFGEFAGLASGRGKAES